MAVGWTLFADGKFLEVDFGDDANAAELRRHVFR
jgi:hypothetical protein